MSARITTHLKELMAERGLTISDVHFGTKLSEPAVRRWYYNQIRRVDGLTAAKLCAFLDCTQAQLYTVELIED